MPDVLYKYLPPARIDVLRHGRIRFSPVQDLNDPFESRPLIRVDPASAERSVRASGFRGERARKAVLSFTEYAEQRGTETLWNLVNDEFGILSLSADPLHPVMWGQYAAGYAGYVLGLDARHTWLTPAPTGNDIASGPQPVMYQVKRPSVEIAAIPENVDHDAFHRGLFLTKHEAWAFEQEFRVGKDVRGALPPDQTEGVTNLFHFPPDVVLEVLMGPRMSHETGTELEAILRSGKYPNARLHRLALDAQSYLMRAEPVALE